MEDKLIRFMTELAAFNKLTLGIVKTLSRIFEIDCIKLCENNGIVYFFK